MSNETAIQIAAAWILLSIITGLAWAAARALGWAGLTETHPPPACGDTTGLTATPCTEPAGHTDWHGNDAAGIRWPQDPQATP